MPPLNTFQQTQLKQTPGWAGDINIPGNSCESPPAQLMSAAQLSAQIARYQGAPVCGGGAYNANIQIAPLIMN